jgi:ferric-dicitrate binding protein FerR (iron transport regulator)
MKASDDSDLMRALGGDAEARRRLTERVAADPELASGLDRIERAWSALELPPVAPPPPGFAARVAARARVERRWLPGLPLSPLWASALAAALVAVGVAGGASLGLYAVAGTETDVVTEVSWPDSGQSLADEYLTTATTFDEGSASGAANATENR